MLDALNTDIEVVGESGSNMDKADHVQTLGIGGSRPSGISFTKLSCLSCDVRSEHARSEWKAERDTIQLHHVLRRYDENHERPFSNTNICDFTMCTDICFICNGCPRQLEVPIVPPYGRSEGESESVELNLSVEPSARAACITSSLALSRCPTVELPTVLPVWGLTHSGMLFYVYGMCYDSGLHRVSRSRLATSQESYQDSLDSTVCINVCSDGQPYILFETDGSMTRHAGTRPGSVHTDVMQGSCL